MPFPKIKWCKLPTLLELAAVYLFVHSAAGKGGWEAIKPLERVINHSRIHIVPKRSAEPLSNPLVKVLLELKEEVSFSFSSRSPRSQLNCSLKRNSWVGLHLLWDGLNLFDKILCVPGSLRCSFAAILPSYRPSKALFHNCLLPKVFLNAFLSISFSFFFDFFLLQHDSFTLGELVSCTRCLFHHIVHT